LSILVAVVAIFAQHVAQCANTPARFNAVFKLITCKKLNAPALLGAFKTARNVKGEDEKVYIEMLAICLTRAN